MSLNLDDRYPGRSNGKTLSYPQGSFKNRTSPTSQDGTFLEQDWANDQLAFFQSLIKGAGMTANGAVDTVEGSQYFDALREILEAATPDASEIVRGLMEIATTDEALSLADDTVALTPAKLADATQTIGSVVGTMRNGKMVVTTASPSAIFTADEIIVEESLGGRTYRVAGFNKTVNLAIVGAGGMDSGTAPASGFVALYALYNPTTGAQGILATNATAAVSPEVYGGANMPAGYTASALISVWPTNSSGQFSIGSQFERRVGIATTVALSTSVIQTTSFVTTAIPKNAKFINGSMIITSSSASMVSAAIYDSEQSTGGLSVAGYVSAGTSGLSGTFSGIAVTVHQTVRYGILNLGAPTLKISISAYTF